MDFRKGRGLIGLKKGKSTKSKSRILRSIMLSNEAIVGRKVFSIGDLSFAKGNALCLELYTRPRSIHGRYSGQTYFETPFTATPPSVSVSHTVNKACAARGEAIHGQYVRGRAGPLYVSQVHFYALLYHIFGIQQSLNCMV